MYLSILADTFNVTGPIFILVMIGYGLKRIGFLDEHFIQISSKLVFSLCLPLLLFVTIIKIGAVDSLSLDVFNFSILGCVLAFVLSWLVAIVLVKPRQDRGVFVQGCFRSNLGVVGLALCVNAYGDEGLALASLLMASMTVVYNILSVIVLSYYQSTLTVSWSRIGLDIVKNPLIVAILLAFVVVWLALPVPTVLVAAGTYLGNVALPLALLGTGAGISLGSIRQSALNTLLVTLMRTLILPFIITLLALQLGFRGISLGVLFLLFISPTATASFIMAKAMGANAALAANVIVVTTLVSLFTCSLGLFVLKLFQLA
ncbi:MAG: AEC family transporter [Pseudomonadales bacterium]|nr:AEC family transporter [Pseudomonadales bacterium]